MELERVKNQIKLSKKAYDTLNNALTKERLSDLEIDWVLQRFEYNIELLRKTCKVFLLYKWVKLITSPKDVFKEIYSLGFIEDLEIFYSFLDIRNSMSHMYSQYLAKESFDIIKNNYNIIIWLISDLEKNI